MVLYYKNIYSKTCDSVFYLAITGGKVVGRIKNILQKQYNALNDLISLFIQTTK